MSWKDATRLAVWYARNGDTEPLLRLEDALDHEWRTVPDIAARADASQSWVGNALPYLLVENRAQVNTGRTARTRRWRAP
jgi:hypothetical protein